MATTMPNDSIGFNQLLGGLKIVHNLEIIFEVTCAYSRRLQAFLEDNGYAYILRHDYLYTKKLKG